MRARAASSTAATRREVEQSIARFEKRLDDANDALGTLGKHLGRGAQSSYKEVTAALRTLRRDVVKTNKEALKDFDKLRAALTASSGSGRAKRSSRTAKSSASSGARKSTTRASGSRSTGSSRATSARKASTRASGSRAKSSRSRAKKSS